MEEGTGDGMSRNTTVEEKLEHKFHIGDRVVLSNEPEAVGTIVELTTFKPDGKKPSDFPPGLYGSPAYGIVWRGSSTATYHFERNLNKARKGGQDGKIDD